VLSRMQCSLAWPACIHVIVLETNFNFPNLAMFKNSREGEDLHYNRLVNFVVISLFYINVMKINIITFRCISLANYSCGLRPGNARIS
jgi:hypothetical protein